MKLVVITPERIFPGEAQALNGLFAEGLQTLHLRKPAASAGQTAQLLAGIEAAYRCRIVVHDHFALAGEFGLKGVHLNSRNPRPPAGFAGQLSRSCHSLAEVAQAGAEYEYLFLSPVFDSISKEGYGSAFARADLLGAKERGVINARVYALGGIDEKKIPDAARMGFGGVAILGALWEDFLRNSNENLLSERWRSLSSAARAICRDCSL